VEPNGNGGEALTLCRINQNDLMRIFVSSNFKGDGYDFFQINNYTAGCTNSCVLGTNNYSHYGDTCGYGVTNSSWNSDSATDDCINERVGGEPLAHWDPADNPSLAHIQYCVPNNDSDIGSVPHFSDHLISDASGNEIAKPDAIFGTNNNNFDVTWLAGT
jgi:hypothetical protein